MKKIIKLVYVIVLPLLVITLDIMLFTTGKWEYFMDKGSPEFFIVMGVLHFCAIGAALSFGVLMEKTKLFPYQVKGSAEAIFAVGFGWTDKKLHLVLPFYIVEFSWKKKKVNKDLNTMYSSKLS